MGGLFSKPKAPTPTPSPAVEETVTAQEQAVEGEAQRQKTITAKKVAKKGKKRGMNLLLSSAGSRPDYAEPNLKHGLKQKLGGGVRNPRYIG